MMKGERAQSASVWYKRSRGLTLGRDPPWRAPQGGAVPTGSPARGILAVKTFRMFHQSGNAYRTRS